MKREKLSESEFKAIHAILKDLIGVLGVLEGQNEETKEETKEETER